MFVSIISFTVNKSINSVRQAVAEITVYDRFQLACYGIVCFTHLGLHNTVMGPNSLGAEWIG